MAHLTALPAQNRLRVLAADSTSMSTQLLVEGLGRDSQLEVIESPSNGSTLLDLAKRENPHVAIVSANLGGDHGAGYDLVREIRSQVPSTRVIVLLDASDCFPNCGELLGKQFGQFALIEVLSVEHLGEDLFLEGHPVGLIVIEEH